MTSLSDKVARAKELDAKRTQGEWRNGTLTWEKGVVRPYFSIDWIGKCYPNGEDLFNAQVSNMNGEHEHNAAFIAHAPQMAALIAQLWHELKQQRAVMEQALEALENCKGLNAVAGSQRKRGDVITSLKQALGR